MAEARDTATHALGDNAVRVRIVQALEHYRAKGHRIETRWDNPSQCSVKVFLTPMTKLDGTITLAPGRINFLVTYPGVFDKIGGRAQIAEYLATFRAEVAKWLR